MNTWTPSSTLSIASPISSSLSTFTPIKRQLGAIEASDSGSVPEPSQTSETASSSGSVNVGANLSFWLFEFYLLFLLFCLFNRDLIHIFLKDCLSRIVAVYTFCIYTGRDPEMSEELPDLEART
jgi:hypothetical protein